MENDILCDVRASAAALLCALHHFKFDAVDGKTTVAEIARAICSKPYSLDARQDSFVLEGFLRVMKKIPQIGCARDFVINDQSWLMGYDRDGLNACTFEDPHSGDVYVTYKGTAKGEWNDNGIALAGQRQTNAFYLYDSRGEAVSAFIEEDFLSIQQAQALDYFARVSAKHNWKAGEVIVAGHSKGGNKAQLVAIFRDEVKICFSFNGQGFSAEALAAFKRDFPDFERRVSRIYSISCCNDPVSAMGDRLVSEQGRRYVSQYAADKPRDYHEMYTIIGEDLRIESSCERGQVSLAAERLWDAIRTSPDRALAVTAAMNASERYLGSGLPVNGEYISQRDEMRGEFVTARLVLKSAIESVKGLEKVRTRLSELKAIIGTVRTGQKKRITPHLFSSSRGERISVDTAELRSNAAGLAVQANAQISQINASDREIKVFERERTRLIAAANVLQGQAQDYESAEAAIARLARWTIN